MANVVVLGSSGFDLTVRLARLPKPGETLLGGELHTGPGGKGANQAIAARRAGAEVLFLTAFGDDDFGRLAAENCRAEGLDLRHAKTVERTSNQVALIFVGSDGANLIGVAPGASLSLTPDDIEALPDTVFTPGGVFLASLEVPPDTVKRALQRARAAGMTTIVNPAPACDAAGDPAFLSLVDVLTPNEEEAAALSGVTSSGHAGAYRAARVLRDAGVRDVIVTLGEAGCLIVSDSGTRPIPAPRVDAVDTVGAGDAFSGALAVALAEGRDLDSAAAWAAAAGSIAVTKPGAQGALPRREDIDANSPPPAMPDSGPPTSGSAGDGPAWTGLTRRIVPRFTLGSMMWWMVGVAVTFAMVRAIGASSFATSALIGVTILSTFAGVVLLLYLAAHEPFWRGFVLGGILYGIFAFWFLDQTRVAAPGFPAAMVPRLPGTVMADTLHLTLIPPVAVKSRVPDPEGWGGQDSSYRQSCIMLRIAANVAIACAYGLVVGLLARIARNANRLREPRPIPGVLAP